MRERWSGKRNRTAVAGVMLALGLALGLAPTAASGAGAAGMRFQHCGTLRGPGARFAILAYRARCQTARRVFGGLFAGRGHRRRDPATGQIDEVVDGWICGGGAGGFGCGKLGPGGTIRQARPGQPALAASPTAAPAPASRPPCTKKALAAGLKRGTVKLPGDLIEGFRCAGRWAIAVVLDGVDDVPSLFRARGTRWFTINREKPCEKHAVPKKIYAAACLSS